MNKFILLALLFVCDGMQAQNRNGLTAGTYETEDSRSRAFVTRVQDEPFINRW